MEPAVWQTAADTPLKEPSMETGKALGQEGMVPRTDQGTFCQSMGSFNHVEESPAVIRRLNECLLHPLQCPPMGRSQKKRVNNPVIPGSIGNLKTRVSVPKVFQYP